MSNFLTIERAALEDAEVLHEIQRRAFLPDIDIYGDSPGNESIESLSNKIENCEYYRIIFNKRLVGGFHIEDKGNGVYRLRRIYIDPDIQNAGIGTKVLKRLDELYPNVKKWTLDTPFKSYRNQHFYEKFGFEKVSENKLNDRITLFEYERNIEAV